MPRGRRDRLRVPGLPPEQGTVRMTAMGMDDDDFDPEELAEETATRAYMRVLIGKGAVMILTVGLWLAFIAGDYAFGVKALWLVPRPLSWLLSAFMAVEFYAMTGDQVRFRRERRRQETGRSREERTLASVERLRERPLAVPWWRAGARSPWLWLGLVIRGVYSACAGLVLVSSFSPAAASVALVAFTAGGMIVRARVVAATAGAAGAVAFTDPRPPRDTPEM